MRFDLSEEQAGLRDLVREVLGQECQPSVVRAAWPCGDPSGPRAAWEAMAELGAIGVLVPEKCGGLGLEETYLVPVLEEIGYAALPGPFVETAAVAAPLLAALEVDDTRPGELLAYALAGTAMAAVDVDGTGMVPYGGAADVVVCGGWAGKPPLELLLAEDVETVPQAVVDGSRPIARVRLDHARPAGGWRVVDEALVELSWLRGVLGTAAQLVGLARRMLDLTVEYVGQREQFGVPVGSYQAVKHKLADALLAVEFAAPAVYRAGWSLAQRDAAARGHVSMAKALAADAATVVARTAIQCHGAIGYTVEYDLHLYAKRAWALAPAWGSAAWHRGLVAELLMPTRSEEVAR